MRKVGDDINRVLAGLGGDSDTARLNLRIMQVRERYKKAIESVYPGPTAQLHLAHTNNVIITNKGGERVLIVYVDDSLFAAELNAQRELIKLRLLELFGEDIADFQINVSRWKKYRDNHPYLAEDTRETASKSASIPLNDDEKAEVRRVASVVDDKKVRESLERAMTADLEWKKGEKVETEGKNTK